MNIEVTIEDELIAARLVAATAAGDAAQLQATMQDLTAGARPGGVLPVLLALSANVCYLAATIDPDKWIDGVRAAVAALTAQADDAG